MSYKLCKLSEESQLSKIDNILNSNKDISIVYDYDCDPRYKDGKHYIYHTSHKFAIAPIVAIYDIKQLQNLMLLLIPDLKPKKVVNFEINSSEDLIFGQLFFEEQIGNIVSTQKTIILDQAIKAKIKYVPGLIDGEEIIETLKPIMFEITLCVLPSIAIAQKHNIGFYKSLISKKHLRREMNGTMPENPYTSAEFNEKLRRPRLFYV